MARGLLVKHVKMLPQSMGDILRAVLTVLREHKHEQERGERDDVQLASNKLWQAANGINLRCLLPSLASSVAGRSGCLQYCEHQSADP